MKGWWLAMLLAPMARAESPLDEFVPYTDGRLGGCYKTPAGKLYSCSRPPRRIDETRIAPEPEAAAPPTQAEDADAREELRRVMAELEELKRRQAADDARRELAERDAARAEREKRAAERADEDAAMAAYNAIEAAKDSENLKRLQEATEACRGALEAQGYSIVGPGACKSPSGSYENCPEC